jgi:hypothetical protein
MFVDRVIVDKWSGEYCDNNVVKFPSTDDIEKVIDALDAKVHSIVSLYGKDGSHLTIGGGCGQYVVFMAVSDEEFWNLISSSDDQKDIVFINVGGQEGDFPVRQVVNKAQVRIAARTFSLFGQLDSSLQWEKQS